MLYNLFLSGTRSAARISRKNMGITMLEIHQLKFLGKFIDEHRSVLFNSNSDKHFSGFEVQFFFSLRLSLN